MSGRVFSLQIGVSQEIIEAYQTQGGAGKEALDKILKAIRTSLGTVPDIRVSGDNFYLQSSYQDFSLPWSLVEIEGVSSSRWTCLA